MDETLVVFKCDASLLGGSYTLRLVRRLSEEKERFVLLLEGSADGYNEKRKSVDIPSQTVDKWFEQLSRKTVPVFNDGLQGCDGATYQLNFYNGLNVSRYQWWCEAPEGYQPLVDFGNQLLKAVDEKDRLEIREHI